MFIWEKGISIYIKVDLIREFIWKKGISIYIKVDFIRVEKCYEVFILFKYIIT